MLRLSFRLARSGPCPGALAEHDFEVTTWYGVLDPADTARPIVARLNAEIVRIMHAPEMKERLAATATDPV